MARNTGRGSRTDVPPRTFQEIKNIGGRFGRPFTWRERLMRWFHR